VETKMHPDVEVAMQQVRPVLDALNDALRPEIERLQRNARRADERGDEEAHRAYSYELMSLMEGAERHRQSVMSPVLAIMNMTPPSPIIEGS
jgi:hypothetical protein